MPAGLDIQPINDQSLFVKAALEGVVREGALAATLTSLMILLFLGSWRSTVIIAMSIPLAVLSAIFLLAAFGQTLNIMTLGGLALAVGILVDDATVTIENINWHLGARQGGQDGHPRRRPPDRGPRLRQHPVHLRGVRADVRHEGRGRLPVPAHGPVRWCSPWSPRSSCRAPSCRPWPCICCASTTCTTRAPGPPAIPWWLFQRGFEARFTSIREGYRNLLAMAMVPPQAVRHRG